MAKNQLLPSTPMVVVENWCHTQSNIIKFNFTWKIDNFRLIPQQKNGLGGLRSSTFSAGAIHKSKWFLRLDPKVVLEDKKEFVSLFLNLESLPSNKTEVLAKFSVSILNSKGKKHIARSCDVHNFIVSPSHANQDWGYIKFISREYLFEKANIILPEDRLTILCELEVLSDRENISGEKNIEKFKTPKCNLGLELGSLLVNKKFCNVTLVVGDYEFQAHKNILSARSDVFAAMFEHEMEEKQLNRVTITDVDQEVLQDMLHFIYTGDSPNLSKMPDRLFAAADKYALEHLKLLSEEALFSGLSIETAASTLVLAHLHSANQLKKSTIDFINSHAKEVVETNEWKYLVVAHPSLVAEAFEALFAGKS